MRNFLQIVPFVFLSVGLFAQDNLKIMQYNLTYYGQTTSWCTTTNNNVSQKDGYLNTIIDYVNPDVFCVNELGITYSGGDNIIADRLLNNVMGSEYARGTHTGTSNICNMIYYRKSKLGFVKQTHINKDLSGGDLIREIDFYTLYYKDTNLATHKDTIYLTFCVAHLKAGSWSEDELERQKATAAAMKHIEDKNYTKNVFFMGDLNLYTDQEQAYQNLTNHSNSAINFYDPINQEGEWHNGNFDFGAYHTQSTRDDSNTNDDCYSGGGLDDRFDFILINKNVRDYLNGVQYKSGTYKALGQDGSATDNNSAMATTTNTAVDATTAQALFEMSDHLPVVLELEVTQGPLSVKNEETISSIELNNPFNDELKVRISARKQLNNVSIDLYDITGQNLFTETLSVNNTRFFSSLNTKNIPQGIYLLTISDNGKVITTEKVIKY